MNNELSNCWEILQCGREPGGANTDQFGVCPAAEADYYDNINQGINAGRFCWSVAGTLCHGEVMGSFASKASDCMQCNFYLKVVKEQPPSSLILNPSQLD